MLRKAQQSPSYRKLPALLREIREQAQLTQRDLGARMRRPQSWIYNCETANRRVDVTEFVAWAKACGINPAKAFTRVIEFLE